MDRYIKQIQTRMNRSLRSRNQSVTKQQVRDVYLTVVSNPDKPTDMEMSRVIELLAKQLSSQEEVISDGQLTVSATAENQEPASIKMTAEDNPDLWETLESPSNSSQAQREEASSEVGELAITQNGSNLPTYQPEEAGSIGITQAQIVQAVELAIAQTGESGSTEAKQIMTQLALHLSSDINTLEQAVAALVTGYLNKRSNVLKNAMGALNTLRNAQTNSFCSGLTPDFLAKQETAKKQLMEIANIFS